LKYKRLGTKSKQGNYFQYVFVEVDLPNNQLLKSLRRIVREEFTITNVDKSEQDDDDYFPHLSLMYGNDSKEENRIAQEIIQNLETNGTARATELGEYEIVGETVLKAEQVWVVRCEGKVEDWEVMEKIKL